MAWRWPGDKPLSEPMMVSLLTHICITRHQLVKKYFLYILRKFDFIFIRWCIRHYFHMNILFCNNGINSPLAIHRHSFIKDLAHTDAMYFSKSLMTQFTSREVCTLFTFCGIFLWLDIQIQIFYWLTKRDRLYLYKQKLKHTRTQKTTTTQWYWLIWPISKMIWINWMRPSDALYASVN